MDTTTLLIIRIIVLLVGGILSLVGRAVAALAVSNYRRPIGYNFM